MAITGLFLSLSANYHTITYHMRTIKRWIGRAYAEKGDYQKAANYFYELAALTDSLKVREQRSAALELAAVYETAEKEAEIQTKNLRIERQRTIIWSVLSGLVILIIALFIILSLYRKKTAAYKALAQRAQQWARQEKLHGEAVKTAAGGDVPTDEDRRIIIHIEREMMENHAYRQPGLTAEALAERLGIHRNTLSRAVNLISGSNFNNYINSYRIAEAVRIISETDRRELYIEELSERVGFGNRNTFTRAFKQFTGLSPLEYQKQRSSSL